MVRKGDGKIISIGKLINVLIFIFISLSIYLPKSFSKLKLVLLLILCIVAFLSLLRGQIYIKRNILLWYFFFILYYLLWIGMGLVNGNSIRGLIDTFRLYVIYPIIFLLFTIALSNSKKISLIFKAIIFSNFLIALNTILLFTNKLHFTSFNLIYKLSDSAGGAVHDGFTKIGADNINSLFFTFPFLLTYFNYKNKELKSKNGNILLIINIIFTIFAGIISGRRMLQIIIVLIITINLFLLFLKYAAKIKLKHFLFLLIIIIGGIGLIFFGPNLSIKYFSLDILSLRIREAFAASSNNVRYLEVVDLYKAFTKNPIIGVGFAKGIDSLVRSSERPWSYEVTYLVQLYQTGVIGILFYISLLFYNVQLIIKIKKSNRHNIYTIPLLLGYVSFLLACFSDPLFGNFDFMWVIYIIPTYYSYLDVHSDHNVARSMSYNSITLN